MGRRIEIVILAALLLGGCRPQGDPLFSACDESKILLSPHHLLVEKQIDGMISQWSDESIDAITVISPNHFLQGHLPVEVPNDIEHGWAIYRDKLAKLHPEAKFNGLMIRVGAPKARLDALAAELAKSTDHLLFTVDFSHGLSGQIATVHDARSIDLIEALDSDGILSAEVDSPETLYVMIQVAKLRGEGIQVVNYTNPSLAAGIDTFENTTHVYACTGKDFAVKKREFHSAMHFAKPREFYIGRTLEDRYLYGYDEVSFNEGGVDHAVLNSPKQNNQRVDFDYFTNAK